jgi:hypothetical protein
MLLTKSVDILSNMETLPVEIRRLEETVAGRSLEQNDLQAEIAKHVSFISVNMDFIVSHSKKTLSKARQIGNQAAQTMNAIASLMANIKELMIL